MDNKDETIAKDVKSAFEALDELNPHASFLNNSPFSSITDWIDTGSMVLNAIISGSLFKGIPVGRVTLFAGESQVGKSLFILKILKNAQDKGLIPVIFDSENAIDSESAARIGLDTTKIKYLPVTTIEGTRNQIFKFLNKVQENNLQGKFIIAIDSLGNLSSAMELQRAEKDSDSADRGSAARAMGSLMRILTNMCTLTKTTAVCTNHVFDDPAALFPSITKNMPGGKKVAYLPSVTVQLARKPVKGDGNKTFDSHTTVGQKSYEGIIIRALTVKNRIIKQYLEGEMYLSFSAGLSKFYGLLPLAVGMGVVEQTGSTYLLDGKKLGYFKSWRNDKDVWKVILKKLDDKIKDEWAYSNKQTDEHDDVPPDDEFEQSED